MAASAAMESATKFQQEWRRFFLEQNHGHCILTISEDVRRSLLVAAT